MSLQALDEPRNVARASEPAKRERIPKRVQHACALLAEGKVQTITDAAERVKLSRSHLSRMLGRPHIQAFIAQEARRNISTSTWRASQKLVDLLGAQSEHVAAKVADRILTSEGILRAEAGAQVAVNVGVSVGYVIDTSRRRADHAVITHSSDVEAKALTGKDNGQ